MCQDASRTACSSSDAAERGAAEPHHSSHWMVEAPRTGSEKSSVERRYYLSRLRANAERLAEAVRGHWGIEKLDWVLDVAFREDESRIRTGHAAEKMTVDRRIALNLRKHDTSVKLGVANKRLKAGWYEAYLLKILFHSDGMPCPRTTRYTDYERVARAKLRL